MTKIDKTDIENIKTIKKETNIKDITNIKIKKGDYEIEISSKSITNIDNKINQTDISPKNITKELNEKKEDPENIVKSPMVGVTYLSADPKSPPYVKVGQHVKVGDTLLLIEAMKTFNEIKAPKSGVIKKILALNSQPVEYGDDLVIFE
tara:strand:+ start:396 stop:842 length:447 start_codon:yes stop_codon:yes gene_type:complete